MNKKELVNLLENEAKVHKSQKVLADIELKFFERMRLKGSKLDEKKMNQLKAGVQMQDEYDGIISKMIEDVREGRLTY